VAVEPKLYTNSTQLNSTQLKYLPLQIINDFEPCFPHTICRQHTHAPAHPSQPDSHNDKNDTPHGHHGITPPPPPTVPPPRHNPRIHTTPPHHPPPHHPPPLPTTPRRPLHHQPRHQLLRQRRHQRQRRPTTITDNNRSHNKEEEERTAAEEETEVHAGRESPGRVPTRADDGGGAGRREIAEVDERGTVDEWGRVETDGGGHGVLFLSGVSAGGTEEGEEGGEEGQTE